MQTATNRQLLHSKRTTLFIILNGIFLTNAIIAEVIGTKIFSLEKLLQIAPAQIQLWGVPPLDFNLTAGVIIWPLVFVTTDLINEYFGTEGVKKISWLAAFFIAYSFLIFWAVTYLPPADFWLEIHQKDDAGNYFNINFAFATIFLQGLGIIIGSITAFLVGQLIDAYTFQAIKKITGSQKIWLRATGSTLVSQLIDSVVVLFVAFYIFGKWSLEQVISVSIINYIYKFVVAIALTPLLYVAHAWIDEFLASEPSKNQD
jgi:uncharacterized integral membrane protein (TIGR00697 family)